MKIFPILIALACMSNMASADIRGNCPTCPPVSGNIMDILSGLTEEPAKFAHRSTVIQLGIGFRSNVNLIDRSQELNQLDVKMVTPSLSLTIEKNVGKNIGIGMTLGNRIWQVPKFNYQYRYYTGGLRATYHFNVMEKLDPYIGGAATYHRMSLTNGEKNVHESKIAGSIVLGARYYLTEHIGGFFEIGNDATGWFKAGFTFYIP